MSEIHVKEGESLDSALKRFKRSCAKAGIVAEVRKRECYESPSIIFHSSFLHKKMQVNPQHEH